MKRFLPIFGILLVAALTLGSGLVHGWMSNRWGLPEDLLALGEKLDDIPEQCGNWRLESSGELSETEIKMLECAGFSVRTYVNTATGARVQMALIVGPAMPISLHRAEICWNTKGHVIHQKRKRVTVEDTQGTDQEFYRLTFQTNDLARRLVRVYYGWSDGSGWSEQTESRLSRTRRPYLYKIEVAGQLPPGADPNKTDPCRDFLQEFLPAAQPHLVSPTATP